MEIGWIGAGGLETCSPTRSTLGEVGGFVCQTVKIVSVNSVDLMDVFDLVNGSYGIEWIGFSGVSGLD